ncbi:MAG: hypothetical protein JXR76_30265 [Deltaproteobacteria bacterium]|nr:hypothetical protein [Deltaproteobacteria bacterium]
MEIVAQTKKYTIRVYPEYGIVSHQMHGFVEGEEFRKMMMLGAKTYKENGCSRRLSDDSKNALFNKEDVEWVENNWEPMIFETGWKYWAIVSPEQAFGKMAMRGIVKRYKEMGVTVEAFTSYDDALEWLKKQK